MSTSLLTNALSLLGKMFQPAALPPETERPRNSSDDEIRMFIALWAAGHHPKAIQKDLGYADIDKILRAVEGEHYTRDKGYVDPPVLFRPEFDALRREAVATRIANNGPFDSVFDRLTWRLGIAVAGRPVNSRRSKPGTRLHKPPKGFKRHPDQRYYRLAVHPKGKFAIWNLTEEKWVRVTPRPDRNRPDLVVKINDHTVNAAGAVLKTWADVTAKGVLYRDGNRKNLAVENLASKAS